MIMYACLHCKAERWVKFDWKDAPIRAAGWWFYRGNAYCRRCRERFQKRKERRR